MTIILFSAAALSIWFVKHCMASIWAGTDLIPLGAHSHEVITKPKGKTDGCKRKPCRKIS
jgi:hypothetical protein